MITLPPKLYKQFETIYKMIKSGELRTLIPLLPLFELNGKPMGLENHFQLAPLFGVIQPQQMVACLARQCGKSYAIVSASGIRSMLIPNYHQVIVQPQFEMIKRLNNTIYQPLLRSCPVIDNFISSAELSKMTLKVFKNNSMTFMEHAFMSPDRLRGISGAACVTVDECTFYQTPIKVFNMSTNRVETKKISEIKAGDLCISLAFFTDCAILIGVVQRDASYRGLRNCYKVTTRSGRTITCTSGHKLQTDHGTMRLQEIIEYEFTARSQNHEHVGAAAECSTRKLTGRCESVEVRPHDERHSVEPFEQADGLRAVQVPDIARVRNERTAAEDESRLRGILGCINSEGIYNISLYVCTDTSEQLSAEDCYQGILKSNHTSYSPSLVVYGRWEQTKNRQYRNYSYKRLYGAGGPAAVGLASLKVASSDYHKTSKTQFYRKYRLYSISTGEYIYSLDGDDTAICSNVHAVQDNYSYSTMCVLRSRNPNKSQGMLFSGLCSRIQSSSESGLCNSAQNANSPKTQRMERTSQRSDQRGSTRTLQEYDTRAEAGFERVFAHVPEQEPRGIQRTSSSLQTGKEMRSNIYGEASAGTSTVLSTRERGSCSLREEITTEQGLQTHGRGSCKGERISSQAQSREACARSRSAGCLRKEEGTYGDAIKHDSRGTRGVHQGICQEPVSQTHERARTESGSISRAQGETAPKVCGTLGQHVRRRETKKQRLCEKTQSLYVARGEGGESGAKENLVREEYSYREGGSGVVCRVQTDWQFLRQENQGASGGTRGFIKDPIVSVEYVGAYPVYDIEVIGTHNYMLDNGIISGNCQDMNWEFIPIIEECMSASINWGYSIYTGTPKTTDNTLSLLFQRSSQAEWLVPCDACGYFNIPNPEHDLLKMIGKHGPICAKCGKPVDIRKGGWVHAYPDRALTFPGLHLAQVCHALHSINDNKWRRLVHKIETLPETTLNNEVFGWPYDDATTPLTLNDLIAAEYDPTDQYGNVVDIKTPADIKRISNMYSYITVGCDWGGGSAISDSYTAFAVIGLRRDKQTIDVLYTERIPKGVTPTDEARIILNWISGSGANAFAFDNGGAGFVRTEIMKQEGLMNISGLVICPQQYGPPSGGDVMKLSRAQREKDYTYYVTDKSRSLAMCIAGIKSKRIRLRRFRHDDEDEPIRDFLALIEDPRELRGRDAVILISRKAGRPDDMAHAINFACCQLEDHMGAHLPVGRRYDTSRIALSEDEEDEIVYGPRGDFDRFQDAISANCAVIEPDYDYY